MRSSTLVLLVVLSGCGGSTPPAPSGPPTASTASPVSRALAAAGLRPLHREEGFLAPGERHTFRIEAPGGCHALVSTTSQALRDLDVAVYRPDGELLAEDVEPDDHPTVRWCGDAGPVYVVAHAYAGAGRFELSLWAGDEASMEAVAAAAGGAPPIGYAPPLTTSELDEALRRRGFTSLRNERAFELPGAGEPVRFPVELRPGRCVAVVVRAPVAVQLALELSSAVVDEAPGEEVAVTTCADAGPATAVVVGPVPTRVRAWVLEGANADVGGEPALWLGARRPRPARAPEVPAGWAVRDAGRARWPAGHAQRLGGCGRLQLWLEEGVAQVELRAEGETLRGGRVEAEVCGEVTVAIDAPARAAWRWLTRERPRPPPAP